MCGAWLLQYRERAKFSVQEIAEEDFLCCDEVTPNKSLERTREG
jgi:hypothetical protein